MTIYSFFKPEEKLRVISMELKRNSIDDVEVKAFNENKFRFAIGGREFSCSYAEALTKPKKLVAYIKRKKEQL